MTRRSALARHFRPASGVALAALVAGLSTAAHAQQSGAAVTGHASLGMRNVSVDGSTNKFREDINLDDGVRLLNATFSYSADPETESAIDLFEFDASHLGGDPWESIHLGAQKYGVYKLKLDRRRSQYFYQDVILPPALASITGSTGGDFHHFDFERVRDSAALDITLTPSTKFMFGMDRHRRTGDSTTTADIQRDEFELERPLDESMNAANVGVQHSWRKVTLIYERDAQKFENTIDAFLPGASAGLNDTDPADLLFFSLDQSYDYESAGNTLRVMARPSSRFDLRMFWRQEDLDLNMNASEQSAGTTFTGSAFTNDLSGLAAIGRDIEIHEFGFGYLLNERTRLIGEVRRHTLDQRGTLDFAATPGFGLWDMETLGSEFGFEYAAFENTVISAGISRESRDVLHTDTPGAFASVPEEQTDRSGFFATVSLEPVSGLTVSFSVEDDDIDDAYTLASPTGTRRYRVRAGYQWDNGLALNASVRRDALENDRSGWDADTNQVNIRLSWASEQFSWNLGLTQIDLDRLITATVTAGSRQDVFAIDYGADIELLEAGFTWQFNDRMSIGSHYAQYDNEGSFPLERDDYRAFIEFDIGSEYALRASYRDIEFLEDRFDDYDAELLEVAFDVRW
jgi:hypothetical protein